MNELRFDSSVIEELNIKERGVLLTLLFLSCEDGVVRINQSDFARKNGLTRQEVRAVLKKLRTTNFTTNSTTNSGTNSTTNLTLNKSAIYKGFKTIPQPIPQPNKKPIQQPIQKAVSETVKKTEPIDFQAFVRYFNSKVEGTRIPKIMRMTDVRKSHLLGRCKEYGKKSLSEVIDKVLGSPMLCGENDNGWHATFDWIFNSSNFIKIMEGNYDEQRTDKKRKYASGRGDGGTATAEGVANEILRRCQAGEC